MIKKISLHILPILRNYLYEKLHIHMCWWTTQSLGMDPSELSVFHEENNRKKFVWSRARSRKEAYRAGAKIVKTEETKFNAKAEELFRNVVRLGCISFNDRKTISNGNMPGLSTKNTNHDFSSKTFRNITWEWIRAKLGKNWNSFTNKK